MTVQITPAGFYTDIRREGSGTLLLAGPYRTHDEALAAFDWSRDLALNYGPWHAFDYFGTCKLVGRLPAGIFTPLDLLKTTRDTDGYVIAHHRLLSRA